MVPDNAGRSAGVPLPQGKKGRAQQLIKARGATRKRKSPARSRLGRARLTTSSKRMESLFRLQLQRRRIDAVAQSGRAGAVLEHVAEVAVALRAQHFGPDHAVADVALFVDMAVDRGGGKARPAAAGIELGVGFDQGLAAAGAGVGAPPLVMLVFAGERPFGRL